MSADIDSLLRQNQSLKTLQDYQLSVLREIELKDVGAREATRLVLLGIGITKYDIVRSLGDDFKGYIDIP